MSPVIVADIETVPLELALAAPYPEAERQPPGNYKKDERELYLALKEQRRAHPDKSFVICTVVRGRWPNTTQTDSIEEVERVDCGQWGKTTGRYRIIEGERGPIVVAAGDPRIKGLKGWVPTGITREMTGVAA